MRDLTANSLFDVGSRLGVASLLGRDDSFKGTNMTTSYPTLGFGHSEQTQMIRESVHAFAQEHIAPIAADIDRDNRFPRHLWPMMGELGLHGITVSEDDGGTGLGYLQHTIALEEISRASASVGLSYGPSKKQNTCQSLSAGSM